MSIFRQALIAHLKADADIASIIGAKVYGYLAPQNANLPFLVVSRVGGTTMRNLSGQQGVKDEAWQVSCYSKKDYQAEELADAVIQSLDKMQPYTMTPDSGVTTFTVDNSLLESVGGDIEQVKGNGSETKTVHKPLTFRILRSINAN